MFSQESCKSKAVKELLSITPLKEKQVFLLKFMTGTTVGFSRFTHELNLP